MAAIAAEEGMVVAEEGITAAEPIIEKVAVEAEEVGSKAFKVGENWAQRISDATTGYFMGQSSNKTGGCESLNIAIIVIIIILVVAITIIIGATNKHYFNWYICGLAVGIGISHAYKIAASNII
jgi:hypothetical protein